MSGWRIHAKRSFVTDNHEVVILNGDMIARITLERFDPTLPVIPTLVDDRRFMDDGHTPFMRAALNAAWEMGLRPDGFDDTRESMKATNRHLEDMRSIAFGKLSIEKP